MNGLHPTGGLVKGLNGNLYGINSNLNGYGQVFRLTASGQFSILYQFQGGITGDNPANLILGGDGNLYGTASGGVSGDGLLFQLTPAGAFKVLHEFTSTLDGSGPNSLVQAGDGTFYGTTANGGPNPSSGSAEGTLCRVTLAGEVNVLHVFVQGTDGGPTTLITGNDGTFYGTTSGQPNYLSIPSFPATLFQFAPASGTYKTIGSLPVSSSQLGPNSLIQASDGNFYGTTAARNFLHVYTDGTAFRVTPAGEYTNLHTFSGDDGYGPVSLTEASDGNFYGVTREGGPDANNAPGDYGGAGTAFQLTPNGVFTSLYRFTGGTDGLAPDGPLLEIQPGVFRGIAGSGGETSTNGTAAGGGLIYELTIIPLPQFFYGQAPLADNVYYLSFPDGDYFGYYSFLTDPRYIYHFDLGYEYVFDAADGKAGVYFYDFQSSHFFYTSPTFGFPYLYDFSLHSVLYYYPDPDHAGRYNTGGVRYFYDFATGQVIVE